MEATDRRVEVLDHARRVIMRDGLSTTSLRRISREGGYTTGVLSHYFADKRELIAACFEWTHKSWLDHVEVQLRGAATPETSLCRYITLAVPRDPQRQLEWRVWLEFCAAAVGDSELADLLLRVDQRWQGLTARALGDWIAAGLVQQTLPIADLAATLLQCADGLGLRAIVTGDWDGARVRFVSVLRALGMPAALADEALKPASAGAA